MNDEVNKALELLKEKALQDCRYTKTENNEQVADALEKALENSKKKKTSQPSRREKVR